MTALFWGGAPAHGASALPDVSKRLCLEAKDPDAAPDKHFLQCRLERVSFAPAPPPPAQKQLKIGAFNLEMGHALAGIQKIMTTDPDLKDVDVWLVSEANRGCAQQGGKPHVAAQLARALNMHMAYGVEFLLVDFATPTGPVSRVCEHGNAILSRYPLANVRQWRHKDDGEWYSPPDKRQAAGSTGTRLGGRVAVAADVRVGEKTLRVYSLHLANTALSNFVRVKQSKEVIADAATAKGPVVVGGDLNTDFYYTDLQSGFFRDPTPKAFKQAGFADAHMSLPAVQRATNDGKTYGPQTWDLLFVKGATVIKSGVCPLARCGGLSDHLPVWTVVGL